MKRRYASIIGVFGPAADRYVVQGYTEEKSLTEMLEMAKKVKGLEGIEVIGGWHINEDNSDQVTSSIAQAGFKLACVIPEIWAEPKWGWGSFASTDPGIRREAIRKVKNAMDIAAKVDCNLVSPWFGHDGWDYILQMDYMKSYDWIIEGLSECGEHNPKVNIAVEFKLKEPRNFLLVSNTAKTLLLLNEVNLKNVGINLDVGHALFGYENMAESVALMTRFGDRLMHLHLNDNYRYWDQDMIPCSVHTLEWIELFHWLDRVGYRGWFSLDIFAYREKEKVAVGTESLAWLDAISAAAERLDGSEVDEIWKTQDAMRAQAVLREALLGK